MRTCTFACVLVILVSTLTPITDGAKLLTIDPFTQNLSESTLIFMMYDYGTVGNWYSPYTNLPPSAIYVSTPECVGGQRDLVIGYTGTVPPGSVAVLNVISGRTAVSLPLDWEGTAYLQWDGFDNAGTTDAFPGSRFNPGFTTPLDLTFAGQGQGLAFSVVTDHDINYVVSLLDSAGARNAFTQTIARNENLPATPVVMPFSSTTWSHAGFNFQDVRGIEVQVRAIAAGSHAPDTNFTPLYVYAYSISGSVTCDCANAQPSAGKQVDLISSGSVVASTTTDSAGAFHFWALNPATYSVCVQSSNLLCSGSAQCTSVTVSRSDPGAVFNINIVIAGTYTVPADYSAECSSCQIPDGTTNCPAAATMTDCHGVVTVPSYSDTVTANPCTKLITRTWVYSTGFQYTQRLTFTDTHPPVIVSPAQDATVNCATSVSAFPAWLTTNGGAQADEACTAVVWSNNFSGTATCNSQYTVTFTAADLCGNAVSTTATFTISDPTPSVSPTPSRTPSKGSSKSPSASKSASRTRSITTTPSISPTRSVSTTPSISPTKSATITTSKSVTASILITVSPSRSGSSSATPTSSHSASRH